jgi:hypothetical protein
MEPMDHVIFIRADNNDQRLTDQAMACGWCKGFIHEEFRGGMWRWIHDQQPRTLHEVLPYAVR